LPRTYKEITELTANFNAAVATFVCHNYTPSLRSFRESSILFLFLPISFQA